MRSGVVTYADEQLSRSPSREYYYRDSGNESTATITRYGEDTSIKQLIQSGISFAGNPALEDQEIQAITAKATPDVKDYPINIDHNPELVVRPNTQRLTYKQDIAVRYLKPATPPPPGVTTRDDLCLYSLFFCLANYHPGDPCSGTTGRPADHPASTSAAASNAFARDHPRETASTAEIRPDDGHSK